MRTNFLRRNITNLQRQHQEKHKAITARVALQKMPDIYFPARYKGTRTDSHKHHIKKCHRTLFRLMPGYIPGQLLPPWIVQSY